MKNESSAERPLDPTTARIVAELAEALLPRLKEAVMEELSAATRVLPQKTGRDVEETLAALKRLREAADSVASSLAAVEKVIEETAVGTQAGIERLLRDLEPSVARIESNVDTADEATTLLRSLEAAIPDWEGVLKADGRAHTRELSELSAEMSELLRDTRTSLLSEVRGAVEKELEKRDGHVEQLIREEGKRTDRKLAGLQKTIAISAALFPVVFAVAVALLWQ